MAGYGEAIDSDVRNWPSGQRAPEYSDPDCKEGARPYLLPISQATEIPFSTFELSAKRSPTFSETSALPARRIQTGGIRIVLIVLR